MIGMCWGGDSKRPSSSPSIAKRERPSSCDSNWCWESKRCIRETRSEQSSCNSHLQNISTRGRSCIQVLRMACWEGGGGCTWCCHTSLPVELKQFKGQMTSSTTSHTDNTEWRRGQHKQKNKVTVNSSNPVWNAGIRLHVLRSGSSKQSRCRDHLQPSANLDGVTRY